MKKKIKRVKWVRLDDYSNIHIWYDDDQEKGHKGGDDFEKCPCCPTVMKNDVSGINIVLHNRISN